MPSQGAAGKNTPELLRPESTQERFVDSGSMLYLLKHSNVSKLQIRLSSLFLEQRKLRVIMKMLIEPNVRPRAFSSCEWTHKIGG